MDSELKEMIDLQKEILKEIDDLRYGDLDEEPTVGEKFADRVVTLVGSWKFLITQGVLLGIWMALNIFWLANMAWDPYPFILLNLLLSFQAAFTAPIILMAQNRSEQRDRRRAQDAYRSIERIENSMGLLAQKLRDKNGNGKINGTQEKKE